MADYHCGSAPSVRLHSMWTESVAEDTDKHADPGDEISDEDCD